MQTHISLAFMGVFAMATAGVILESRSGASLPTSGALPLQGGPDTPNLHSAATNRPALRCL